MRKSESNVNADRRAIRQALAILEEEEVIIDDNDDIDHNNQTQAQAQALSSANIDEGLTIRHNQAALALSSVSWSPVIAPTTKSSFTDRRSCFLNPPVFIQFGSGIVF